MAGAPHSQAPWTRSRKARVATNKAAMEGEPTNLLRCTHSRSSRYSCRPLVNAVTTTACTRPWSLKNVTAASERFWIVLHLAMGLRGHGTCQLLAPIPRLLNHARNLRVHPKIRLPRWNLLPLQHYLRDTSKSRTLYWISGQTSREIY